MSMKRQIKRNQRETVIQKINERSYNDGFSIGRSQGIRDTIAYYTEKLETLTNVKGIGDELAIRILFHLGYEHKAEGMAHDYHSVSRRS